HLERERPELAEEARVDVLGTHAEEEILEQAGIRRPARTQQDLCAVPERYPALLLRGVRGPAAHLRLLRHEAEPDRLAEQRVAVVRVRELDQRDGTLAQRLAEEIGGAVLRDHPAHVRAGYGDRLAFA